jgi:cobalt-zinc-cadmium efflux system membrane fusion protein
MPDTTLKSTGIEIITAGSATIKSTLTLPGEIIFNHHTWLHLLAVTLANR